MAERFCCGDPIFTNMTELLGEEDQEITLKAPALINGETYSAGTKCLVTYQIFWVDFFHQNGRQGIMTHLIHRSLRPIEPQIVEVTTEELIAA